MPFVLDVSQPTQTPTHPSTTTSMICIVPATILVSMEFWELAHATMAAFWIIVPTLVSPPDLPTKVVELVSTPIQRFG